MTKNSSNTGPGRHRWLKHVNGAPVAAVGDWGPSNYPGMGGLFLFTGKMGRNEREKWGTDRAWVGGGYNKPPAQDHGGVRRL
jgi:hypothetical protein